MVFANQGLPSGPLGADTLQNMKYVSFAVMGLWVCGIARLFVDSPFNGIATLFAAICGTYTFMNDKKFAQCYEFMASNCVVCGLGGAHCVAPLMTISLINAVFDIFRFFGLLSAGVAMLVPVTTLVILVSIVLQLYVSVVCMQVLKQMLQPQDSLLPRTDRPFLQPRQYVSLASEPRFVPFGGEGRRLEA